MHISLDSLRKFSERYRFIRYVRKPFRIQNRFWAHTIYENFRKIFGIFGNFLKLLQTAQVFGNLGNGSKLFFRSFYDCFKNFFVKSSKIFNLRKCSEIFGNFRKRTKPFFRSSVYDFFKNFSKNLWNSPEVFGNLRKRFKIVFPYFLKFLKFSENPVWKCSEIIGKFADVIEIVWKHLH